MYHETTIVRLKDGFVPADTVSVIFDDGDTLYVRPEGPAGGVLDAASARDRFTPFAVPASAVVEVVIPPLDYIVHPLARPGDRIRVIDPGTRISEDHHMEAGDVCRVVAVLAPHGILDVRREDGKLGSIMGSDARVEVLPAEPSTPNPWEVPVSVGDHIRLLEDVPKAASRGRIAKVAGLTGKVVFVNSSGFLLSPDEPDAGYPNAVAWIGGRSGRFEVLPE